jgi:hypothetical protein
MNPFKTNSSLDQRRWLRSVLSASGLALALLASGGASAATLGNGAAASPALEVGTLIDNSAPDIEAATKKELKLSPSDRVAPRVIELPALVESKDATSTESKLGQPVQIGVARNVAETATDISTGSMFNWSRSPAGGYRAAISVRSPGAKGLRLGLLVEQLPPGTQLRVYAPQSEDTFQIEGAEVLNTLQRNLDSGATGSDAHTYWLPSIEDADEAVLEIELPSGVNPNQLKVSLPQVSHLKISPTDETAILKAAGSCETDSMCAPAQWDSARRAVARMAFVMNGTSYVCTGTMLNNTLNDFTPYFLSANHCISTQTVASTLETWWNYRSTACNSGQVGSYQRLTNGAQLLYANANTDTSFMRLNSKPSNGAYLGWSTSAAAIGNSIFAIHHPSGDLQKYSAGAITSFQICTPTATGTNCSRGTSTTGNVYQVQWSLGVTESGSSGSPLLTSSSQVIGQLWSGNSSCSNTKQNDYYGRFDLAYKNALSQWLSPAGYTIAASAGTGGTINPSGSVSVTLGATKAFTVAPSTGYSIDAVSGTCGGTLSGNTYTTKAITASCTVAAAFKPIPYIVTASAGTGGTINPSGSMTVNYGSTKSFTLTPSANYSISSVGGTCGGTPSGNTYTTKAITTSCTVQATFVVKPTTTYTVTASAGTGGSISPSGTIANVTSGTTRTFSVTPSTNYNISSVGGTCGGTRSGNTYTTKAITGNCTVQATFVVKPTTYTVTASAGTGGSISPSGNRSVTQGEGMTFQVTPSIGNSISSVGGTCGAKFSSHNPGSRDYYYIASPITASCTVTASFTPSRQGEHRQLRGL